MWKFKIYSIIGILLLLNGCSEKTEENLIEDSQKTTMYVQDPAHLYLDDILQNEVIESSVLNYEIQSARWLTYLEYTDIMLNKSENDFKSALKTIFTNAKNDGINTIYVHTRAFGDAYYNSDVYPRSTLANKEYDPLAIMIEEAHNLDLSVHAWINPLRCQTVEEMGSIPDDYITKKWYNESLGTYISEVNGRLWLNPAYDEVIDLIINGVREIVVNYDVDGIHIDDYFYPTTDTAFDDKAFSESGASDLSAWRIGNINKLVSKIYSTIKEHNIEVLFGISPQGNINGNYSSQYADVKAWVSSDEYCDYIVPQVYFGFENTACPFEQTVKIWYDMTDREKVDIIIGLAVYKEGKTDSWAGEGENEWIENDDIIERQIDLIKKYEDMGYSLYY